MISATTRGSNKYPTSPFFLSNCQRKVGNQCGAPHKELTRTAMLGRGNDATIDLPPLSWSSLTPLDHLIEPRPWKSEQIGDEQSGRG